MFKIFGFFLVFIIGYSVFSGNMDGIEKNETLSKSKKVIAIDKQEKKCDNLVKLEQIHWKKMTTKPLGTDLKLIRNWNDAQIKARGACSADGYLYDGIIQLNKDVRAFGKAGGYKINY